MIYFSVFLLFFLGCFILIFERYRVRGQHGADTLTLFLFIYYIQVLIPVFIFLCNFIFFGNVAITENFFFDKVLVNVNEIVLCAVSNTSLFFFLLLYFFTIVIFFKFDIKSLNVRARLIPRKTVIVGINILGLLSGFFLVYFLSNGDGVWAGYANLISFRSLDVEIERNFVNANLFSLTQAFLLFSFILLFCLAKEVSTGYIGRRKYLLFILIFVMAAFCVSRRSLLIPVLLWIMTIMLLTGRVRLFSYFKLILPLAFLIFAGKDFLSFISGARSQPFIDSKVELWPFIIKVACDIGITNVESFATFLYMNDYIRFGQDHIYSILQRIPDGILGFDIGLPERIVRVSTEIFTDKNQADIPPGFIGQMWLDFRWFGPLIYSIVFSFFIFIIEYARRRIVVDAVSCAFFSVIIFIFCLPLNSGSLDFNFSIDIMFFLFFLPFCFKFNKIY